MSTLELTPEERKLMVEILQEYISEMRMEVGATENYDFKEQLQEKENALKAILKKL